jgi:hypothetical protein
MVLLRRMKKRRNIGRIESGLTGEKRREKEQ